MSHPFIDGKAHQRVIEGLKEVDVVAMVCRHFAADVARMRMAQNAARLLASQCYSQSVGIGGNYPSDLSTRSQMAATQYALAREQLLDHIEAHATHDPEQRCPALREGLPSA